MFVEIFEVEKVIYGMIIFFLPSIPPINQPFWLVRQDGEVERGLPTHQVHPFLLGVDVFTPVLLLELIHVGFKHC